MLIQSPNRISAPFPVGLDNTLKARSCGVEHVVSVLSQAGDLRLIRTLNWLGNGFKVENIDFGKFMGSDFDKSSIERHCWSDDGQFLVLTSPRKILVLKLASSESFLSSDPIVFAELPTYFRASSVAACVDNNVSSLLVAASGSDGCFLFEMPLDGKTFISHHLHESINTVRVEFSPHAQFLAIAAMDSHIGVWNLCNRSKGGLDAQRDLWYFFAELERVTDIGFAVDGRILVVSCWDGTIVAFSNLNMKEWCKIAIPFTFNIEEGSRARSSMSGTFFDFVSSLGSKTTSSSLHHDVDDEELRIVVARESTVSIFDLRSGMIIFSRVLPSNTSTKGIVSLPPQSGGGALIITDLGQIFGIPWPLTAIMPLEQDWCVWKHDEKDMSARLSIELKNCSKSNVRFRFGDEDEEEFECPYLGFPYFASSFVVIGSEICSDEWSYSSSKSRRYLVVYRLSKDRKSVGVVIADRFGLESLETSRNVGWSTHILKYSSQISQINITDDDSKMTISLGVESVSKNVVRKVEEIELHSLLRGG